MKKNIINTILLVVFCALAVWQVWGVNTPFDELAEEIASVEISTKASVNDGSLPLDEDYAQQVLDTVASIRLCGKRGFLAEWTGWNDGSITRMFTLVLSDGTRIGVGENFPDFVMDGVRYRTALSTQKYIDELQELYFAHPDHCPCG